MGRKYRTHFRICVCNDSRVVSKCVGLWCSHHFAVIGCKVQQTPQKVLWDRHRVILSLLCLHEGCPSKKRTKRTPKNLAAATVTILFCFVLINDNLHVALIVVVHTLPIQERLDCIELTRMTVDTEKLGPNLSSMPSPSRLASIPMYFFGPPTCAMVLDCENELGWGDPERPDWSLPLQ